MNTSALSPQPSALPPPSRAEARLGRAMAGAVWRTFRGEIWEHSAGVPMARGYANEGEPFDIQSACYLKAVQRAIRLQPFGKFVILAAVQMLKTFGTIEDPAAYFIAQAPGDMGIYFPGGDTAFDQAKARLMPRLRSVPEVGRIVDQAEAGNRHDVNTAEYYLRNMVLRVWPLNESTTQRITLRYVMISDAFLAGKTGLLKQAIARKTQHDSNRIRDYKVIIESQGCEKGDDFQAEWETTDQRLLHTVCPGCGTGQAFEWHRERPEDFSATLDGAAVARVMRAAAGGLWPAGRKKFKNRQPARFQSIQVLRGAGFVWWHALWEPADFRDSSARLLRELETARVELSALLCSKPRRHAGFKRGDEELIRREDGSYNEPAILAGTYYECFHCGGAWRDWPAIRRQLDEAAYYVASNPNALPENIGFSWPAWAGQRLSWGMIMLEFLHARRALEKYANADPYKQWLQKRAARIWDPDGETRRQEHSFSVGSHETDPAKKIPDEHSRNMTVDCQKDEVMDVVGTFWYVVRAWDKYGNSKQLARGFARNWAEWIAVQQFWKVPNARVCIDASKWTPQIMLEAASRYELVTPTRAHLLTGRRDPFPSCWRIYYGSDGRAFDRGSKVFGPSTPETPVPGRIRVTGPDGKHFNIQLYQVRWSNLMFELQLDGILSGMPGRPKFEKLPREALSDFMREKETGILTYESQMSARYPTEVRGKQKYEDLANREAHYRDCELMQLVRAAQDGLLGHLAPTMEAKEG